MFKVSTDLTAKSDAVSTLIHQELLNIIRADQTSRKMPDRFIRQAQVLVDKEEMSQDFTTFYKDCLEFWDQESNQDKPVVRTKTDVEDLKD